MYLFALEAGRLGQWRTETYSRLGRDQKEYALIDKYVVVFFMLVLLTSGRHVSL